MLWELNECVRRLDRVRNVNIRGKLQQEGVLDIYGAEQTGEVEGYIGEYEYGKDYKEDFWRRDAEQDTERKTKIEMDWQF